MHGKCKKYANKNVDVLSNEVWAIGSQPSAALGLELWGKARRDFEGYDLI